MRAGLVCNLLKKYQVIIIVTTMLLLIMPLQAALKDPTRPPTATTAISSTPEKTQRPRWILTSTLVSAQRRTAVINDTVVSHGDRINGAKVINIQPTAVRLRVGRREITVMILKNNVKSLSQMTSSRQGK